MTEHDDDQPPPAVLIVEDQPELLQSRLRNFAQRGVQAIGAERAEQAAAFMASAIMPVSLVIIDINLRPDAPWDRSGLALARLMNAAGVDVPVVGYSAHFEPEGVSSEDRREFSAWIEKARLLPAELSAQYAGLAQDAAAAERRAVLPPSKAAGDALVAFLAETHDDAGDDVSEARAYLKTSVGARAYDPLDDDGPIEFDPLPARVRDELHFVAPEET